MNQQKNARAERTIGSYRHIYRSLASALKTKDWPSIIDLCTIAYNVTPTLKSGLSPFQVYFNRSPHIFIPTMPQLMAQQKATDIYKDNESLIAKIKQAVMKSDAKQTNKYIQAKNKKARDRKDILIGTLCLLKDLSTPKAGEEAKKVRPLYRKDPFVVVNRHKKLVILRRIKDGKIYWSSECYVKPVASRKDLFENLPEEIKRHISGPFRADALLRNTDDFKIMAEQYYRKGSVPGSSRESAKWDHRYFPMETDTLKGSDGKSISEKETDSTNSETIRFSTKATEEKAKSKCKNLTNDNAVIESSISSSEDSRVTIQRKMFNLTV